MKWILVCDVSINQRLEFWIQMVPAVKWWQPEKHLTIVFGVAMAGVR